MKFILAVLVLALAACTTPLKPQPAGTTEIAGTQGDFKYVITKVGLTAPICTLLYMPGVDEDQNAVRSGKYPHDELVPMARKLGCVILVPSEQSIWLLGSDIKPSGMCSLFGGCKQAPTPEKFLEILQAIMTKHGLPPRIYAEGVSQGGFNLATLAMKVPDKFVKVIIAHPVMLFRDMAPAGFLALTNFTPLKWLLVNPVNVIKNVTKMPMTYVTTCEMDAMVPSDAAQEFARIGKSKRFDLTLHIDADTCSHGDFDSDPAIAWMIK